MTPEDKKAQDRYWMRRSLDQLRRDLRETRQNVKDHTEDAQRQAARINEIKIRARELNIDLD